MPRSISSGCLVFFAVMLINNRIKVEGLTCWTCDGKDASPLCDPGESFAEGHKGTSQPCPPPNVPMAGDPEEKKKWACWIMETVVKSTGHVEVSKGCIRFFNTFLTDQKEFVSVNQCFEHNEHQILREVNHHKVSMCFCDTSNDCNKETLSLPAPLDPNKIINIGFGDIHKRLEKESEAAFQEISILVVIAGPLISVGFV